MTGETGPATALVDERAALWAAALVVPARRDDADRVAQLRREVHDDLPALDRAARSWSGLGHELSPVTASVVGRVGFVRANLASLRGAFEPLERKLRRRPPGAARVLGVQLGALLGMMSTKVLGQFVLPFGGPGGGQLLVIGPNVLELSDEHGALAGDIRRTVVLHEITHRLQFDATPWLGDHLRGLLERYLGDARVDGTAVAELAPRLPEVVAEIRRTGSVQPLLKVVLTDAQAEVIDEAQGLMSLLEGHGNAAMYDAADRDVIADPEGVRAALAQRRTDLTARVLTAVAGLEMKKRQYREGEAFVRQVLDLAGVDGLNRAFAAPSHLPRADEVDDPARWLARVTPPEPST